MFECLFQSLQKTDSPKRDSQMEREQNTNDKKEQRKKGERQPNVLKLEDSNENGKAGMGERYLYGNAGRLVVFLFGS